MYLCLNSLLGGGGGVCQKNVFLFQMSLLNTDVPFKIFLLNKDTRGWVELNLLTPKSDWHINFPNNISPESNPSPKVTEEEEMNTN